MGDQVLLLVIGFGLTSMLGGALRWFFQTRSWSHQHRAQQRDDERVQALKAFEEVSSLLDRRLYRMQRVFWAATPIDGAFGRDAGAAVRALQRSAGLEDGVLGPATWAGLHTS
jgi:peptidoglycan hydrolase-like protein with peptidoglycan-binding domain